MRRSHAKRRSSARHAWRRSQARFARLAPLRHPPHLLTARRARRALPPACAQTCGNRCALEDEPGLTGGDSTRRGLTPTALGMWSRARWSAPSSSRWARSTGTRRCSRSSAPREPCGRARSSRRLRASAVLRLHDVYSRPPTYVLSRNGGCVLGMAWSVPRIVFYAATATAAGLAHGHAHLRLSLLSHLARLHTPGRSRDGAGRSVLAASISGVATRLGAPDRGPSTCHERGRRACRSVASRLPLTYGRAGMQAGVACLMPSRGPAAGRSRRGCAPCRPSPASDLRTSEGRRAVAA